MQIVIYIQNGQNVYAPVVANDVTWSLSRKGQPGKLSFTVIPDNRLKIEEGNAIRMDADGTPVFFGFLFERSWGSDGEMKITAYDRLRYLKNTDSYNYTNLTASELLARIAGDYHLRTGIVEDTGHVIPYRNEKDKTLFDIILNALDLTMMATGNVFVLYDDVGKLTLKNIETMKLDRMICDKTAQNYDFKTSIDSGTYNQIKLYRENSDTKKRDIYMVKDSETINRWGILQKNGSIGEKEDGKQAAETYLSLYNRPTKSLRIQEAFGDICVRAGCLIPTFLDIKEMSLKNYMLVEDVTHKFSCGFHTMDLTLRGAGIDG